MDQNKQAKELSAFTSSGGEEEEAGSVQGFWCFCVSYHYSLAPSCGHKKYKYDNMRLSLYSISTTGVYDTTHLNVGGNLLLSV